MKRYEALRALANGIETDAAKFYNKSNNAAGTRLRKDLLELKALAQSIRKEVLEKRKKV